MSRVEKIGEWLKFEKPETYDFVESTQRKELVKDYGDIENPIEQFLVYKYDGKVNWDIIGEKNGSFQDIDKYVTRDPDTSSYLLQDIYKELWPQLVEQEFMKGSREWICSDVMTSAMYRLQDALRKIEIINTYSAPENVNQKVIEQIRKIHDDCQKRYWWSKNRCILVAANLVEDFYKLVDDNYSNMANFLKKTHTIGNFCPVPKGFNTARAGAGVYDCWDLTLMKIHKWYKEETDELKEKILIELLHHEKYPPKYKECRNNCREWLEWFEKKENKMKGEYDGWQNFVEILFMRDYVDDNYEVDSFWTKHGWGIEKTREFPEDNVKINEALEKITKRIEARSETIVNECRKRAMINEYV